MVQAEPWLERDKVMIDQLKSLDIAKDRSFEPDANTTDTLKSSVIEAHEWFDQRYETAYPPYYSGEH